MMSNIAGNKMLNHLDRVLHNRRPITADMFLNNYCNNKCPYCTYRRWEFDNGARYMSFEDFKKYAKRLIELGVKGLILSGGGEPTISRDFDKIVGWLDNQSDLQYGINTNFNVYKQFSPAYLKVSLDAYDEDSYYENRGVCMYNTVRENIKTFVSKKAEKTNVGIQQVAKSVEGVYKFYEANKDLPVDYISIRPMESICSSYYKNLSDSEDTKPENIITAIKQLASSDSRVVLNYKWNMLDVQQDCCTAQWAQIAVNEVGEVMYCCHKPYQIVGHIMDDDILEKKEKAYTLMNTCDVPCRMTGPNLEVATILNPTRDANFI